MLSVKNKKGFSLVELLVVVAIIGVLSAIAIPSFNRYKKEAKKTAFTTDLQNLYKAVTVFGALSDNFCISGGDAFSLENIGMNTLTTSVTYTTLANTNNFIGFGATTCAPAVAAVKETHYQTHHASQKDAHCILDEMSFTVGVAGNTDASTFQAWQIDNTGTLQPNAGATFDFACVP